MGQTKENHSRTERIYPPVETHCPENHPHMDHVYEAFYKLKGYKPITEEQFVMRKQMIISSV